MKWERSEPIRVIDEQEQSLIHFGVPGMKWGVRREIGKRAREAAVLTKSKKSMDFGIRKLGNKIERDNAKGKFTSSLEIRKKQMEGSRNALSRTLKKKYSDLSREDAAAGERSLTRRTIIGAILAGPLGAAIAVAGPSVRAFKNHKPAPVSRASKSNGDLFGPAATPEEASAFWKALAAEYDKEKK